MRIDTGNEGTQTPDAVLLDEFVSRGDQEAFVSLMRRHGPYILGVCRRVTAHAQDAEDVYQACFLELVRNAPSIRRQASVGGWLQTVAVRLARKARTRRTRQRHEALPADPAACPEDVSWREVRLILEEELANLPEKLRAPIVLCLFEGLPRDEAAQYLEISADVLKYRLRQGRQRLQRLLQRRGVSLAVLGVLLSAQGARATVPAALSQATLQAASALTQTTALAGVASPAVLGLLAPAGILSGWGVLTTFMAGGVVATLFFLTRERPAPPPPAPAPQARQKVYHSFLGKQFDARLFRWTGPKRFTKLEDEGLRVTLPEEKGPEVPVGVMMRPPVRGDFDVEASFELLRPASIPDGRRAGVTIYLFLPTPQRDGLWFGKMHERPRGPVFALGQRLTEPGKERTGAYLRVVPTQPERGKARLRVERHGAMFHFLAAEGDDDFQHIDSVFVSGETVPIVRLAVDPSFSSGVPIDARFIDFSISAEELVGHDVR